MTSKDDNNTSTTTTTPSINTPSSVVNTTIATQQLLFLEPELCFLEYDNGTLYQTNVTNDCLPDHDLYDVELGPILFLSLLYGSIAIISVIGNTLVIWIIKTSRQMQNVTNFFIANLAFADILIGMFTTPFEFQAALLQKWNLPHFMCAFCPFIQILSVNVSVFTLAAIAIDRYRAILSPFKQKPSKQLAKLIILSIWIVSLILATPFAYALRVTISKYKDGNNIVAVPFCNNVNLNEDEMKLYRNILVVLQYVIPFSIISFAYIRIAIFLWGSHVPGNAQDSRDATILRNKKKVIKMLVIVVVTFGLCWFPLQFYNVIAHLCPEINEYHYINIIWFCCDWLAMSNSCYNPFIYGIYNEKFKKEFQRRIKLHKDSSNRKSFMTPVSSFKNKSSAQHTMVTSTATNSVFYYSIPQAVINIECTEKL
ncbi:RYamide receptor-like [Chrysoperla carnea]|uniref:RYamide receptor-like n=1 Tax=Chrysoperla carnea TaxID=189513 RepID=UPI001D07554A|nr:RYamide receptor-like [Chrysoperla carnea]